MKRDPGAGWGSAADWLRHRPLREVLEQLGEPGEPGEQADRRRRQLLAAELVARASWGVVLLIAPHRVLGLTAGKPVSEDGAALVVARILGARHLLQAAGGALVPGRTERRLAAAVDGVHAIACLALAVRAPRYARGALVDAILATTWCVLSLRTVRTHSSS